MIAAEWTSAVGPLRAIEPTPDEIRVHAPALSGWYNEPGNAALLGHTALISPVEVIESYAEMAAAGARPFLLFRDGELAGDGDLRHFDDGAAELAWMIGSPAMQGKGLGTRFAQMITWIGFSELGLSTIFASVVPHNTASRRVFEKLGYVVDASPRARTFADEPDDLVLAIDRATFEHANAAVLAEITVRRRYTS